MEYPTRPPGFAGEFVKWLVTSGADRRVGPDGCWLLVLVVSAEHDGKFAGPAVLNTAALMERLELAERRAFYRLRQRCVDAGLLSVGGGGAWGDASYTVQWSRPNDVPIASQLRPNKARRKGCKTQDVASMDAGVVSQPCPNDVPIASQISGAMVPVEKPKKERPRNELFDAVAEVTGRDPATAGSVIGKVAAALAKASPPYTPDEVFEFGRRFWELCPWAEGDGRTRATPTELQSHIGLLRAAGPARVHAPKTRGERETRYIVDTLFNAVGGIPDEGLSEDQFRR